MLFFFVVDLPFMQTLLDEPYSEAGKITKEMNSKQINIKLLFQIFLHVKTFEITTYVNTNENSNNTTA